MRPPISPPNQSQLVRLIAALALLSVGLLLSHAVWSPGAHDAAECAVCFFLNDTAHCTDDAVVALLLATYVIALSIHNAASGSVLTSRTRAPPAVLIILH